MLRLVSSAVTVLVSLTASGCAFVTDTSVDLSHSPWKGTNKELWPENWGNLDARVGSLKDASGAYITRISSSQRSGEKRRIPRFLLTGLEAVDLFNSVSEINREAQVVLDIKITSGWTSPWWTQAQFFLLYIPGMLLPTMEASALVEFELSFPPVVSSNH